MSMGSRKENERMGVKEHIIKNILTDLILEKFIDEQRFSESFCRGKFRIKRWGKLKIKNELKTKENFYFLYQKRIRTDSR